MEKLTEEIANEYRKKALRLPENGGQDIGEWRKLRIELQERCGLTQVQAVNILHGMHTRDYIINSNYTPTQNML